MSEIEPPADKKLSEDARSDVKVVAKGGAVQIAGQISQRSLSFVFGAAFTQLLNPAAYGLYRLIAQVVANLSQVGLLGLNYATMRFVARARAAGKPERVKGAITVGIAGVLVCSLLVMGAVLLFPDGIAWIFERDDALRRARLADLLWVAAFYVPLFAMLQVLRYSTQAYKTMVPSVIAGNIVQPVVRFVLGITALALGFGVTGALISLNISVAVAAGLILFYLRRLMTEQERLAAPERELGPMLRFALPQMGASLLGVQTLGLGLLLLGMFSSDFELGLFAIALSLQGPGNVFLGGIVNIWAPVVSDLYERGEIDRLRSLYQLINRWIATFSFPVFAALLIVPDVFVWFYGGDASQAAPVVMVLALGNIFYTGTGPTGYVISMTGHPGVNLINSVVSVVLYVALGVWLVPEHGALGMAVVDSIVTAIVNTVRVVEAYFLVGIQPFGRTFYKPVVATVGAAAVLLLWTLLPVAALWFDAVGLVVGTLAYLFFLKLLGLDEEEKIVFRRIKKRAFKRGAGKKATASDDT